MKNLSHLALFILALTSSSTKLLGDDMFRNLNYGDSKSVVMKKLGITDFKPAKSDEASTFFGMTLESGQMSHPIKTKVQGLSFKAFLGWNDKKKSLTLKSVDIISEPASRTKLVSVYKELAILMTELYGKPKFNNGLPSKSQLLDNNVVVAGAVWFYNNNAVTLGIRKAIDNNTIVIQFMNEQPKLTRVL